MNKKESTFSKEVRKGLLRSFDLVRVETKEEDGFPDLFGMHMVTRTPVFAELKSSSISRNGTLAIKLDPAQKLKLRWLNRCVKTIILIEVDTERVFCLPVQDTPTWHTQVSGSPKVEDLIFNFDGFWSDKQSLDKNLQGWLAGGLHA